MGLPLMLHRFNQHTSKHKHFRPSPQPPQMTHASPAPLPPITSASAYESQHVHAVYHAIAPHFAATRYAPWPAVDQFLATLPPHALVADIGCGNGKYLRVAQHSQHNMFALGLDRCEQLVHLAAGERRVLTKCDAAVADAMALPLRDAVFDAVLNIAVVHHLATRNRRVGAWRESLRLLRKGGLMLAYVWALERPSVPVPKKGNRQRRMLSRRFESQDVFVPWHMRRRKAGADTDRILGDPEETHHRFYHVYRESELESEIIEGGGSVVRSYYDHQNWCVVTEKR